MRILPLIILEAFFISVFSQQPLWIRLESDPPHGGHGYKVGVDQQNNLYVLSGWSYPGWWDHGSTIIKYSSDGDKLWTHSNVVDTASIINYKVSQQGSSFVIFNEVNFFFFGGIYAVDSSGNEIYSHELYNYVFYSVDCDLYGNAYVAGLKKYSFNNWDLVLIKYSNTGLEEWERTFDLPGANTMARTVFIADSSVYTAGNSWYSNIALKYDLTGNLLDTAYFFQDPWSDYYFRSIHGRTDNAGNVYFFGVNEEIYFESFVYKFDPSLNELWHDTTTLFNQILADLTFDDNQSVVLCGYDYELYHPIYMKYNSIGEKEWFFMFEDGTGQFGNTCCFEDNICFTGSIHYPDSSGSRMLVYVTNSQGNFKNQYIYPTAIGCSSYGSDLILDHNQQMISVGTYEDTVDQCLTIKYDLLTGGIENLNNKGNRLKIYPVPASQFLIVENPANKTLVYEIYNFIGTAIYKGYVGTGRTSIHIDRLASGIYFLMIDQTVYKFVKQ